MPLLMGSHTAEKVKTELLFRDEKFRNIFEGANDCMILLDRSGRIIDVNEKTVDVFGGLKRELLGKHFTSVSVISPRDIPMAMGAFAKVLAGEKPTRNICIKNKKGREIHLEISASLMKVNGKLAGMLVIARDVTERRIMEERISYLASIVYNAKVAIATVDMNGIVTYCNKATEEMLGWTSKEVIGKPMARFCPNAGKQMEATVKEGFCLDKELEYIKRDGSSLLCSTSTFLMKDKDGNPIWVGGIAIDITERKKAEEELIRLSSAVKMSTDSIVISDTDAKIVDVNEATLKMWGSDDKEDLIGKNSFDLIAPEDREKALAGTKETLEKGYVKGREYNIITKDGGRIPVEMSAAVMKDADDKPIGFVGISRDITERKRMEEELRRYSEHLEELVEERTKELKESQEQLLRSERLATIGEVAAMVGHDLRNPLQAITNAVFVINNMGEIISHLREKPSIPPLIQEPLSKELTQLREMIDIIDDSVRYANKVVLDLLDFAKVQEPNLQDVDLNSLIRDVLSAMEIPGNVTVTIQADETLPRCRVDPTQMKRVYSNIVTNALQAMPGGGRLMINSAKKGNTVEVQISDTGVGIPQENVRKVFYVLFTTKAKGAGLGLAVCKKFVEGHGGSIGVESAVGKGSTFTIKLPICQEEGGESK